MIPAEHIFIFTGPTLSPTLAAETLDAVYLPPAKLGDIYRICSLFSPRVIGIVDGYFNQVPAVWHKEILYALSKGIRIFGAASMGALRAAEMDQLGMIGCGEIYRAYKRGSLAPFNDEIFEDDDEVAVIHGPAELNYLAASDALVNLRFTLIDAMRAGIIDKQVTLRLANIAKKLFYAQRSYTRMLEIARQKNLPVKQISALNDWLKHNKINQKQSDALILLETIEAMDGSSDISEANKQIFECTSQWQSEINEIDHAHFSLHPVINELRLKGGAYFELLDQAMASTKPEESKPPPLDPTPLTRMHGSPQNLNRYLSGLWCKTPPNPDSESAIRARTEQHMLNMLEQSGAVHALKKRANDKQAMLDQMAQKMTLESLSEFDRLQLCDWYFSTQLNAAMPGHPQQYATRLGFIDEDEFYAMLFAEYIYIESRQEIRE